MSSNQDLANWWKKGLEKKKTPWRKRSKSESDDEKENDPVACVLNDSFDEVKANTPYKRQDRKWGNKKYNFR